MQLHVYFTYQALRMKKRNYWKQPRFTMHRTLFTMHRTLCEIAYKRPVFIMISMEVRLYLLVTFNDFVSTLKNSKIWIRVFKIITESRRHMCSLYTFITSLQHNIISNLYNLKTNWYFCFHWKHGGNMSANILYYNDLSTNVCMTPLSFWLFYLRMYIVIALLTNCPMHDEFPSDAGLKMNAREKIIFKGEINVF